MTSSEIQEALTLSSAQMDYHTYLQNEFPYQPFYEPLNLTILDAARKGEESISFDFINNDMSYIADKTLNEVQRNYRRIYP